MTEPTEYTLGYTFSGAYKVDLPENVLEEILNSSNSLSSSPLVFQLKTGGLEKNVGVREFSAPPLQIGLHEYWAKQLELSIGDPVQLSRVDLPKGSQITLKTIQDDKDSIDWKSLLESWIPKNYTALSVGDELTIPYLGKDYGLVVTNLEPDHGSVCVVDTDMELIVEKFTHSNKDPKSVQPPLEFSEALPSTIEFNTPMTLPGLVTLTGTIPSGTGKLYISCTELAFIGPEHATSPSSYVAIADSQPTPVSVALLGSTVTVTASGELNVETQSNETGNNTSESKSAENESKDEQVCESCGRSIPSQSFVLHTSFCSRNSCQCPHCSRKFSGRTQVPQNHLKIHELEANGSGGHCECGEFSASSAVELAFHRATTCSEKLHICQFCHLLVPRGQTSPVDAALGLSGHESQCGNRTADCPLCSKPIRLRSLALHLNDHDGKRKQRKPPQMCANQNCPYPLNYQQGSTPPAGLCANCFGPLSVPGANNDPERVKQRIERRYVLQMTRGCGKPWCLNTFCTMNQKRTTAEAMAATKQIINNSNGEHWFCVDEAQTRKSMFVQIENEYAREWRGMAISQCSTEVEAQQWLQKNASKLNE